MGYATATPRDTGENPEEERPFKIPDMIGKQNAAVFPDPVCAHAMRSRPAVAMGMA